MRKDPPLPVLRQGGGQVKNERPQSLAGAARPTRPKSLVAAVSRKRSALGLGRRGRAEKQPEIYGQKSCWKPAVQFFFSFSAIKMPQQKFTEKDIMLLLCTNIDPD
ncbi:unnamed protein product [Caretta caretta]